MTEFATIIVGVLLANFIYSLINVLFGATIKKIGGGVNK